MANLSSPSVIKDVLIRYGFRFSKSLGQNFLIDNSVCPRMASYCGADKETGVIEIGPGIGVLTCELAKIAQRVVAIELDERLKPVLSETLVGCDNVSLVFGDALKIDFHALIEREFSGKKVCVCANLPYYITSPLLMHLLESHLPLQSITVMVQKEAAQRICALPGTRECGAVSIGIHYHSEPEILFPVGRNSFMPPPRVDSSVIRLRLRKEPPVVVEDEKWFFRVSRAAFAQRRKTVVNSISATLKILKPVVEAAVVDMGLSKTIRAEQMVLEQLAELSNRLIEKTQ